MTDQEPDRGKRKRPYCQRVICGVCKKELDSDYKLKIIMPKLCTKDRKLLSLWYVSVIRVSLLFSPRAPRSRGRHRSSSDQTTRLTHMTKMGPGPVGMYKLMALKQLKSRLCRWFWNCRMTKMNTSLFRKLLCVR